MPDIVLRVLCECLALHATTLWDGHCYYVLFTGGDAELAQIVRLAGVDGHTNPKLTLLCLASPEAILSQHVTERPYYQRSLTSGPKPQEVPKLKGSVNLSGGKSYVFIVTNFSLKCSIVYNYERGRDTTVYHHHLWLSPPAPILSSLFIILEIPHLHFN